MFLLPPPLLTTTSNKGLSPHEAGMLISCFQSMFSSEFIEDASLYRRGLKGEFCFSPWPVLTILFSFSCHGKLSMLKVLASENYTSGPNDQ